MSSRESESEPDLGLTDQFAHGWYAIPTGSPLIWAKKSYDVNRAAIKLQTYHGRNLSPSSFANPVSLPLVRAARNSDHVHFTLRGSMRQYLFSPGAASAASFACWPGSPDLQVHCQLSSHSSAFLDASSSTFATPRRKVDVYFEGSRIYTSAGHLSSDPHALKFLQYLGFRDTRFLSTPFS